VVALIVSELKQMRVSWLRWAAACLLVISADAFAENCERLLVLDFALPGLDTATDLAYLAAITPENFSLHKVNATPKMKHLGVPLPIASDLLLHAQDYDEFSARRAQKYAEFGFNYSLVDLATYFRRLLPTDRLKAYNACTGASGFVAQVVRADRDFVQVLASWRASSDGPTQVRVDNVTVTGAALLGTAPKTLGAQPVTLVFSRNLDADLRVSATAATQPISLWVPRLVGASTFPEPADAACADASKVVRALFRQTLGREPKSAELAAQVALLKNGSNSVRQLAERDVLSEEYQKKFAKGNELEGALKNLYVHVLARESDSKGLANNKAQFRNAPFANIVMTFFRTAEYQSRFGQWTVPSAPPSVRYCAAPK
jgi:hypothetical protein